MRTDAFLLLSDAQAVTADAASTNALALGAAGVDVGIGEPLAVVFVIDVAADYTTGDETYKFAVRTATASDGTTGAVSIVETPAIAGFGEAITGQDEFDRQRSALIQQSNSLVSNIIDAAVQGITSLGISAGAGVVGGVVGGAIGGPAGAAAGATTAATAAQAGRALASARGIGAVLGLGAASFPQQLNTFYEAAQNARDAQGRPAYDLNDTSTQLTIFGAALGTSLLDVIE